MLDIIIRIVVKYVQKNADLDDWRNVRRHYFWYSFLLFVNLYLLSKGYTDPEDEDAYQNLSQKNILDTECTDVFCNIHDHAEFFSDIQNAKLEKFNLSLLYQEYISMDYYIDDSGGFQISKGKNARDILGSYYTQSDFTNAMVEKILDNYIRQNAENQKINVTASDDIKSFLLSSTYADNSCGSGEFLVSIIRYLNNRYSLTDYDANKLMNNIYGYDVDPIAVFISRVRIMEELHLDYSSSNIKLGNPLIPVEASNLRARYLMASEGRFYNLGMGTRQSVRRFDIIIGNPPWEKIRFEEKKFLSHFVVNTTSIEKKSDREQFINHNLSKKNLAFFTDIKKDYVLYKSKLKKSKMLELTACGELNTYALFTEWSVNNISERGWISLIVKSSLLKSMVYHDFLEQLVESRIFYEAYLFINSQRVFPIDSREEFSVIFLSKSNRENLKISVDLESFKDLYRQPDLELTKNILKKINPLTGMIPSIKTRDEFDFLLKISTACHTFQEVYPECKYGRIVHLTNHSSHIVKQNANGYTPVYEGKFIEQYNNHYATYKNVDKKAKYASKSKAVRLNDTSEPVECRYFIETDFWEKISAGFDQNYFIAWRSLTSSSNRRTMIATLLPKIPACQSIQVLQIADKRKMLRILSLFNSIIFDYLVRLKMTGLDLTQTIIKQIPVPSENAYRRIISFNGIIAPLEDHLFARVRELYRSDPLVYDFFNDIEVYQAEPKSTKELISEIDIISGILYDLDKSELKRIAYKFDKFYSKKEVEALF